MDKPGSTPLGENIGDKLPSASLPGIRLSDQLWAQLEGHAVDHIWFHTLDQIQGRVRAETWLHTKEQLQEESDG